MNPLLRFLPVVMLPLAATALAESVTVNPQDVEVRDFRGWGTSLCWWAHALGGASPQVREEIATQAFDLRKGLGLTVVRYNIGGGEKPGLEGTMEARARIEGFQPEEGKWNWSADPGQRAFLKLAVQAGVTEIEAFSNSPPWWMTWSGSAAGNHNGGPNLRDDRIDAFAAYLADVTRFFRDKENITFTSLTPLNEPSSLWWKYGGHQEGCNIPPKQQPKILQAVSRALLARGLRTAVVGPEENAVAQTITAVRSYDPATCALLGRIHTHTYNANHRAELRKLAATHHRDIWQSEYGDGDASGMTLAKTIIADLRDLRPTAWVYWQLVDNGGWGLLHFPAASGGSAPVMPKYHIFSAFTRFLRPGCQLVASGSPDALAALDPTRGRSVVIVLNPRDQAEPLTLDLSRFPKIGRTANPWQTVAGAPLSACAPVEIVNKRITMSLPPHSVTALHLPSTGM